MAKYFEIIARKRPLKSTANPTRNGEAELDKCLTTWDLVSLGVGSCCGAGMYLTSGIIASKNAGPAGVFSFCLAGLASVLTGFHYAELAGICPQTSGSAYMYTYVTVGELSAFLIGWGLIVEYVIGTSAAAVALSETLHSLTNNQISGFINSGLDRAGLPHVDVVAATICLLLMWLLASGVQMSARVNNVLNTINFVAWAIFISAAYSLGSVKNWDDHGGFFPFGYEGVFSAIPSAYYAFVGFDGLATTGGECKTPVKSIPISIIGSIIINIIIFSNVIIGLTYNVPYSKLPPDTAMLDMFVMIGYPALKYVLAVGAVSGLFAATFGSLFPLPRVLQAMAQDGLMFRYLGHVCPKRHTAFRATILSGLVAMFFAAFIKLTLLIEMVLIGTLLGYVIVTFVTLVLRLVDVGHVTESNYKEPENRNRLTITCNIKRKASDTDLECQDSCKLLTDKNDVKQTFPTNCQGNGGTINNGYEDNEKFAYSRKNSLSPNYHPKSFTKLNETITETDLYNEISLSCVETDSLIISKETTKLKQCSSKNNQPLSSIASLKLYMSRHIVGYLLIFYGCLAIMCAILANFFTEIVAMNIVLILLLAVTMILVTVCGSLIMFLPHIKRSSEGFRTPMVPFLTVITAAINLYLMTSLSLVTWLLFIVWLFLGLCIYFLYGTRNSKLNMPRDEVESRNGSLIAPKYENRASLDIAATELHGPSDVTQKERTPLLHCE